MTQEWTEDQVCELVFSELDGGEQQLYGASATASAAFGSKAIDVFLSLAGRYGCPIAFLAKAAILAEVSKRFPDQPKVRDFVETAVDFAIEQMGCES